MNPFRRRLKNRREKAGRIAKPPRVWPVEAGIFYNPALPVRYLEPICERVSRVQGDKFERLVASIKAHGLANPLITVSELPEQNLEDWREWRYRFLYTIPAPIKVVVGHNRYAACQSLGWPDVPVLHCGAIPKEAQGELWERVDLAEAQAYVRDGRLGVGPYSLVMDEFTPPLKGVPPGYEPEAAAVPAAPKRPARAKTPSRKRSAPRAASPRTRRD